MSAIIKANARQSTSVESVSEGADVFLRMLRDGSLVNANWKQAGIFKGLGRMVNVGAFSTPIVGGGAGTIIDQDEPELVIAVPSGTSIMPIRIEVTCTVPLISADANESEILIGVDTATYAVTGSAGTTEVAYNLNGGTTGSLCNCLSAVTTAITAVPVITMELMHKLLTAAVKGSSAGNDVWGELYGLYEPESAPIIKGNAQLLVYFGGTVATSGFISAQWLEFPSSFAAV